MLPLQALDYLDALVRYRLKDFRFFALWLNDVKDVFYLSDVSKSMSARQKLEAQLTENNIVKEVRCVGVMINLEFL